MITDSVLGATYLGQDRTRFVVWAPFRKKIEVHLVTPREVVIPMERDESGYFHATAEDVPLGSRYFYRLDGGSEYPDPASRFQPEGVHGSSLVVSRDFRWEDSRWPGLPRRKLSR